MGRGAEAAEGEAEQLWPMAGVGGGYGADRLSSQSSRWPTPTLSLHSPSLHQLLCSARRPPIAACSCSSSPRCLLSGLHLPNVRTDTAYSRPHCITSAEHARPGGKTAAQRMAWQACWLGPAERLEEHLLEICAGNVLALLSSVASGVNFSARTVFGTAGMVTVCLFTAVLDRMLLV